MTLSRSFLIISFFSLLIYLPSFNAPFIFDDIDSIQYNPEIRSFKPFFDADADPVLFARPVLKLTFVANYLLHGTDVFSYHLVNFVLHLLNLLLLLLVTSSLIKLSAKKKGDEPGFSPDPGWLSFLAVFLWAMHPLLTESVVYVTNRAVLLSAAFYLLAVFAFLRTGSTGRPDTWLILLIVSYVLALGSKQTAITLPAVLLVLDLYFFKEKRKGGFLRQRGFLYSSLLMVSLTITLLNRQSFADSRPNAGFGMADVPWNRYVLTQFEVIAHYLQLSFRPVGLVLDYYDWPLRENMMEIFPAVLLVAFLIAAGVILSIRGRKIGALILLFFILLAPTSLLPIRGEFAAERRLYLALYIIAVLVVLFGMQVNAFLKKRAGDKAGGVIGCVAVIFVLIALGASSYARAMDYKSVLGMMEDTVHKRPNNLRALTNLGKAYADAGMMDEAAHIYNRGAELQPDNVFILNALGKHYLRNGDTERARSYIERSMLQDASRAETISSLALIEMKEGNKEAGFELFEKAIALDPKDAITLYNYANELEHAGQTAEAQERYNQALALLPELTEAHVNLAGLLLQKGRPQDALAHFLEAEKLQPKQARHKYHLGMFYMQNNNIVKAVSKFREALVLNPGHVPSIQMLREIENRQER